MSFELKSQMDENGEFEKEILEELTIKTHQIKKVWTKAHLEKEIESLASLVQESTERKTTLEEQLARFTKK